MCKGCGVEKRELGGNLRRPEPCQEGSGLEDEVASEDVGCGEVPQCARDLALGGGPCEGIRDGRQESRQISDGVRHGGEEAVPDRQRHVGRRQ